VNLLPDSNFDSDVTVRVPCFLSGERGSWTHYGAPALTTYTPGTANYPVRGSATRNSENAVWVLKILEETHPFRPEYSIPTAIAELLDVGSLLTFFKESAKSFAQLAGNSYLYYRFGIVQFWRDIKTLHSITTALESRIREFDSLNKQGGLRRKIKLYSNSWDTSNDNELLWSTYGILLGARVSRNYRIAVTGTVRWRWKGGVTVNLSKLEAFNLAVSNLLGLKELDGATIWNSIPWTWLIDYFVAIGPWLQANASDAVEPYDIAIVRRYDSITSMEPRLKEAGLYPQIRCTNGRYTRTIVSRDTNLVSSLLPPVRYGLLSSSQYWALFALLGKFHS
jgi:hypothetical protein